MLGINSYDHAYIDDARHQIDALLASYAPVAKDAAFEKQFFRHMVLALDHYFDHRLRGVEGKDGNPLNEVRMICNSMMHNNGVMMAEKTIKYDPAKSVLGLQIGQEIVLDTDSFTQLSEAFIGAIRERFT